MGRLAGTLDEVLSARTARLPRRQKARLCREASLHAALLGALKLVHGVDARISPDVPPMGKSYVYYAIDAIDPLLLDADVIEVEVPQSGRIAMVPVWPDHKQAWKQAPAIAGGEREQFLLTALSLASLGPGTIDQWVRKPVTMTSPLASMAPILWWEARMKQGYTVDAACTMLSLLVDRHRLADVEALLAETFED